ncbi:membrane metalloendopeptidase protein [Corynebacterium kutscheri]|uniref:Membrane metalloendopeptidase protein n=1 Tax=Corynebacterium kutscheri TaxID=35755 RepID=A0A0F6R287_9CORY|nr:M23 family metallopeptidase [Corynebacterium kutscheri]AKE41473.1 Peptidase family M23 [Corynebacterium kutscheri]VEH08751.1 membrane metalloendopeptidase protein [Corynebacterium kutscheri]VEH09797.1 membrane metalloendopeptidase protein [Corynebacterium kutscheri]VEH79880.1 membrane metalloendopeptidase protein [Corynebacterium kutscheri]
MKITSPYRLLLSSIFSIAILFITAFPAQAYISPTTGSHKPGTVLRGFNKPERNWLPGHRGVDLALAIGSQVFAAEDGTVAFAGMVAGIPVVSIDHADGIRTTYQPVHALVTAGDKVSEGQVIGTLSHPTDGYPGLHWGARTGKDEYLNPLSLLDFPIIRLKP